MSVHDVSVVRAKDLRLEDVLGKVTILDEADAILHKRKLVTVRTSVNDPAIYDMLRGSYLAALSTKSFLFSSTFSLQS